jgi:CRISPR type III-associated protein (TIGR04423 family)
MEGVKKLNSLNEIPSFNFDGYIWKSDSEHPITLLDETFDFSTIQLNPFIVEGLLYNQDENKSYHITHDGEYHIVEYDLNELSKKGEIIQKEYNPHRLVDSVKKVKFYQIWKDEKDPNCNDLPVLTLKATVFCGFKK